MTEPESLETLIGIVPDGFESLPELLAVGNEVAELLVPLVPERGPRRHKSHH